MRRARKWWVRRAFRCCRNCFSGDPSVGKGRWGRDEVLENLKPEIGREIGGEAGKGLPALPGAASRHGGGMQR